MVLDQKVAVLMSLNLPQAEICARTGATVGAVRQSIQRLRQIAPHLER